MGKILVFWGDPPTPSAVLTAERIAKICENSPEALEEGLLVVAMELLEFLWRKHKPGDAVSLADLYLADISWALADLAGMRSAAGVRNRILLRAARLIGGEIERAVRASIHHKNWLAEAEDGEDHRYNGE